MPVEFTIFSQVTLVIFSLLVGAKLRTETTFSFPFFFRGGGGGGGGGGGMEECGCVVLKCLTLFRWLWCLNLFSIKKAQATKGRLKGAILCKRGWAAGIVFVYLCNVLCHLPYNLHFMPPLQLLFFQKKRCIIKINRAIVLY